jgi:hypothetical protein
VITLEEFRDYFNFYSGDILPENFDRCLKVAEGRFRHLLGIEDMPLSLTDEQKELLMNIALIEVAKSFNYLTGEGKGILSINKITEHVERLAWLIRTQKP